MSKDQHERMDVEFHFEGGPRAGTNKAVKVRKDRWLANGKPVLVWKNVQPLAVLGT